MAVVCGEVVNLWHGYFEEHCGWPFLLTITQLRLWLAESSAPGGVQVLGYSAIAAGC